MIEEQDFPDYQRIIRAFLAQYEQEHEKMSQFLNILDDTERRQAVTSSVSEHAARFVEGTTREEKEQKLLIVAIASSVAFAVVEGLKIYHPRHI
jgi:hypothetical protein